MKLSDIKNHVDGVFIATLRNGNIAKCRVMPNGKAIEVVESTAHFECGDIIKPREVEEVE